MKRLIPGRSAYALLQARYRATTLALVVLGFVLMLSLLGVPESWFTQMMLVFMGISSLPLSVLMFLVPRKVRAEHRAGYTTLQSEDKELEQRDPYLGRVIRQPGEDFLQRAEFRAILVQAKKEAQNLPKQPTA